MSPLNDPRDPVKENIGKGTGIGTLTPTCNQSAQYYPYREHFIKCQGDWLGYAYLLQHALQYTIFRIGVYQNFIYLHAVNVINLNI